MKYFNLQLLCFGLFLAISPKMSTAQDLVGGNWYVTKNTFSYNSETVTFYERDVIHDVVNLRDLRFCFLADNTLRVLNFRKQEKLGTWSLSNDVLTIDDNTPGDLVWNGNDQFELSANASDYDDIGSLVQGVSTMYLQRFESNCTCESLMVTSALDNNQPGTLRYVVENACSEYKITFDPSLNGVEIELSPNKGPINIDKIVKIEGRGQAESIIDGNSISKVFTVGPSGYLALSDVTLQNTSAPLNGGAVEVEGEAKFERVFLNNQ